MLNSKIQNIIQISQNVLYGKEDRVSLALCSFFSKGNLLIEDIPGVGKTTFIKFLAKSLGLKFSRIQFTNDILPFDIIGGSFFHKEKNEFIFKKGPLFGELILADELNRAPPKTQSALLQVMEERTITTENQTYDLPWPYTIMATQNPQNQIGTYELPESQLDRFMMKIDLGYPDKQASLKMLTGKSANEKIDELDPLLTLEELKQIQAEITNVKTSNDILNYIVNIVENSRNNHDYNPLSNRASLDMIHSAKAWAYIQNRDYVLPDDIKFLFPSIAIHRLISQEASIFNAKKQALKFLQSVPVV